MVSNTQQFFINEPLSCSTDAQVETLLLPLLIYYTTCETVFTIKKDTNLLWSQICKNAQLKKIALYFLI